MRRRARAIDRAVVRAQARGFTLIELTLAIVLLAVGLLALVGSLAWALGESHAARTRHDVLRQVEGVADSLAESGAARQVAGASASAGVLVDWRPVACGELACLRIEGLTPAASETLAVLVPLELAPR